MICRRGASVAPRSCRLALCPCTTATTLSLDSATRCLATYFGCHRTASGWVWSGVNQARYLCVHLLASSALHLRVCCTLPVMWETNRVAQCYGAVHQRGLRFWNGCSPHLSPPCVPDCITLPQWVQQTEAMKMKQIKMFSHLHLYRGELPLGKGLR